MKTIFFTLSLCLTFGFGYFFTTIIESSCPIFCKWILAIVTFFATVLYGLISWVIRPWHKVPSAK